MADVNQHVNSLQIGGRLCVKPELRRSRGDKNNTEGVPVCQFRIAHNSGRKSKDQTDDKTTFLNCELWGSRAEAASESMSVGDLVEVIGPIQIKSYEKNGITMYYTKCLVRLILHNKRIDSKPQDSTTPDNDTPIEQETFASDEGPNGYDDDIPFE